MTLDELREMLIFSHSAIEKKTDKSITVKVIVKLGISTTARSVCLDVKEVGFDDKSATIYIEV